MAKVIACPDCEGRGAFEDCKTCGGAGTVDEVDPDLAADVAAELAALRREERAEEEQLREWDR